MASKKRLDSNALMNELKEGSVFFKKPPEPITAPPLSSSRREPVADTPAFDDVSSADNDTVIPRHHDTMVDTTVPLPSSPETALERVRRAVKQQGKEAATHRFTVDEKRMLKKIEHDYSMRGVRTSENEITRIAINYLCDDYKRNKDASVLAQILELLNK
jgi:acetylornithine deacetylase/succinyl-diaminopimelate desuccinylase-like protein